MIGNKYCFEPNTQYKYMYTCEKQKMENNGKKDTLHNNDIPVNYQPIFGPSIHKRPLPDSYLITNIFEYLCNVNYL